MSPDLIRITLLHLGNPLGSLLTDGLRGIWALALLGRDQKGCMVSSLDSVQVTQKLNFVKPKSLGPVKMLINDS